jgi:hypothetical protein
MHNIVVVSIKVATQLGERNIVRVQDPQVKPLKCPWAESGETGFVFVRYRGHTHDVDI